MLELPTSCALLATVLLVLFGLMTTNFSKYLLAVAAVFIVGFCVIICFHGFDAVGWAAGRASGL